MLRTISLLILAAFCLCRTGTAQPQPNSTISGRVLSETGTPLRALIAIRSADGGLVRRGFTALDGSFSFPQLPPGQYTFCARIPAEQASRPDQPFLDTCEWERPQTAVPLAAARPVAGVQVTVPKAALLQVRVDDPDQVLPAVTPGPPPALGSQLQLSVMGPNRLDHDLTLASQDSKGRSYTAVVPVDTPLSLTAASSAGRLTNATGQPIQAAINLTAPKGSTLAPVNITLHRN